MELSSPQRNQVPPQEPIPGQEPPATSAVEAPTSSAPAAPAEPQGVAPEHQGIAPARVHLGRQALQARELYRGALASGDEHAAAGYRRRLHEIAANDRVLGDILGEDPTAMSPVRALLPTEVLAATQLQAESEVWNRTHQAAQQAGLPALVEQWNSIQARFKELNQGTPRSLPTGATQEEQVALMEKLQPVRMDPNQVAEMRSLAVKVDKAMSEASNGRHRLWTHPQLHRMAGWLNREAGIGTAGFFTSGPQDVENNWLATGAMLGAEAVTDMGLWGLYRLQKHASYWTGGVVPPPPQNYIEDPATGQLVVNQARPNPMFREVMATAHAVAAGKSIHQTIAGLNEAVEMDNATQSGLEHLVVGTMELSGAILGFKPAAMAMGAGAKAGGLLLPLSTKAGRQLMRRGIKAVARGGPRAVRIARLAGAVGGAAIANGAAMSAMRSPHEEWLDSFWHGMVMGPVLMGLGAAGKAISDKSVLRLRKKMPEPIAKRLAGALGGGVEGIGFGVLEWQQMGLWELLQDPNEKTWAIFAKNVIAMSMMKAFGARTPGSRAAEVISDYFQRTAARREAALRIAREFPESAPPEVLQLARLEARVRQGPGPGQDFALRERAILEAKLDQMEFEPAARTREIEARTRVDIEPVGAETSLLGGIIQRGESARRFRRMTIEEQRRRLGPLSEAGREILREAGVELALEAEGLRVEPPRGRLTWKGDQPEITASRQHGEVGRALQREGLLEADLTGMGRQIMQPEGRLGVQDRGNPLARLQAIVGRRETKAGEKERREFGMFLAKEGGIFWMGNNESVALRPQAVLAALSTPGTKNLHRTGVFLHSHPSASPPSIQDILASFVHQAMYRESAPHFVVTSEGLYRISSTRRRKPTKDEIDLIRKGQTQLAGAAQANIASRIRSIAKDAGVSQTRAMQIFDAYHKNAASARKLARYERQLVQDMNRAFLEGLKDLGQRFGMKIRVERVTADQAWKEIQKIHARDKSPARAEPEQKVDARKGLMSEREGVGSFTAGPSQPETMRSRREGAFNVSEVLARMSGRPGTGEVQVAFREGRLGTKAAEGYYDILENVIRTRAPRDLVVAAHEWSHRMMQDALDAGGNRYLLQAAKWARETWTEEMWREAERILEKYPGAKEWLKEADDPKTNYEVADMLYGRFVAEAWAEINARTLLGDHSRLAVEAPALTAHTHGIVRSNLSRDALRQFEDIQGMFERGREVGAAGRVQGWLFGTKKSEAEHWNKTRGTFIQRAWRKLSKWWIDDMAELRASRDRWLKAGGMKASDLDLTADPARMMDAMRGTASSIANRMVDDVVVDPYGKPRETKTLRRVLQDAEAAGISNNHLLEYVALVRALQVTQPTVVRFPGSREISKVIPAKEVGLPREDMLYRLNELMDLGTEGRSERARRFKEAGKALKEWTDSLVDYVQESGGLTKADAEAIKNRYAMYVPFTRILQGPASMGQGRGVAERGSGAKPFRGSTQQIKDPIAALRDMAHVMIQKAQQARVMNSLAMFAALTRGMRGAGGFATVVPKTRVPREVNLADALKEAYKKATTAEELDLLDALLEADVSSASISLFTAKAFPYGERSIIQVPFVFQDWQLRLAEKTSPESLDFLLRHRNKEVWLEVDTPVYEALMVNDAHNVHAMVKVASIPARMVRAGATEYNPLFAVRNTIRDIWMKPVLSVRGWGGRLGVVGGAVDYIRGLVEMAKGGEAWHQFRRMGGEVAGFYRDGRVSERVAREAVTGHETVRRQTLQAIKRALSAAGRYSESALRVAEFKDAYNEALAKGKTHEQASIEALDAARSATVNFSKGGTAARLLNQMIPYLKAGIVGQARLAEAFVKNPGHASMNAIINVTLPSMMLHYLFKDDEWYADLPDWQKSSYWNMSFDGGKNVISVPKPFELGTVFATLPVAMDDEEDAKYFRGLAAQAFLPYMADGIHGLIPAFAKTPIELMTGYDFFRERPITPDWMKRNRPPLEQVYDSTPEVFQWAFEQFRPMWDAIEINNPLELAKALDGYSAGWGTRGAQLVEALTGLGNNPGALNRISPFPWMHQHAHGALQDRFYETLEEMRQLRGAKEDMTPEDTRYLRALERTADKMSDVRNDESLSREEVDRKLFEMARDALR